jgi:hypothetical protein
VRDHPTSEATPARVNQRRRTHDRGVTADLAMVSPMMVERRWPTCISLAMLGLEKSTITR